MADSISRRVVEQSLKSQYLAALQAMDKVLEVTPSDLWNRQADTNRFWHIAYHALFFTDLYLTRTEEEYSAWERARPDAVPLGENPRQPDLVADKDRPISVSDLAEYVRHISARLTDELQRQDFEAESGFAWIPLSRLECHLYNIRHLQHHTAQLIDRLREQRAISVPWIGKPVDR